MVTVLLKCFIVWLYSHKSTTVIYYIDALVLIFVLANKSVATLALALLQFSEIFLLTHCLVLKVIGIAQNRISNLKGSYKHLYFLQMPTC